MEDDIDTSPGGEYYTSSNSPTSSSRNWTEDMEGGRCHLLTSALPVPWGPYPAPSILQTTARTPCDHLGTVCAPVSLWAFRSQLTLAVGAAVPPLSPPEHPCYISMGSVRGLSNLCDLGTGSP